MAYLKDQVALNPPVWIVDWTEATSTYGRRYRVAAGFYGRPEAEEYFDWRSRVPGSYRLRQQRNGWWVTQVQRTRVTP